MFDRLLNNGEHPNNRPLFAKWRNRNLCVENIAVSHCGVTCTALKFAHCVDEPVGKHTTVDANFDKQIDEEDLQTLFGKYGTITNVDIFRDRETEESLGYGFV